MTGGEFRTWREQIGWSQTQAAEAFKVSRTTIQNWEFGDAPLSPAVRALCALYTREHKKRPDYGPVVLIYADARIMRSPYSSDPIPAIKSECYETMASALTRVDELWGKANFHNPSIQDESETVWHYNELQQRAARLRRVTA